MIGLYHIHDFELLEVTTTLHQNDVLVLHLVQWPHDLVAVEQNEFVVQRLCELLKFFRQRAPIGATQSKCFHILSMRSVIKIDPYSIGHGICSDTRPVPKLQAVPLFVVEFVANIVFALGDEIQFLCILLLPVYDFALLEETRLQEQEHLDHKLFVLFVIEFEIRVF